MLDEFGPERVRNTPISEMAIVGAGIGAAMQGMRPVVEIMYEDFTTLAMEQLVNQAAKHRYMSGGQLKVPLTCARRAARAGRRARSTPSSSRPGSSHVPGLKVVFASTPDRRARSALVVDLRRQHACSSSSTGRSTRSEEEVPEELEPIPLGQGARPPRGRGRDRDRHRPARARGARAPRRRREREGISVEVVDPRTLQPLDEETLVESVKKTNRCVVAHEAVVRGGFGAEVAAVIQYQAFDWLDAPIERVGAKFTPRAVRAGDGGVRRPARRRTSSRRSG